MKGLIKIASLMIILSVAMPDIIAQNAIDENKLGGQSNIISTAVPFLNITPESRAGGMGDVGVATSPDINSQHWNPAKYAFIDGQMGAAFSFTPWLRKLVNDINMYYLTYYYRIDKLQTVSASLRYFSMGDITFTDESGTVQYTGKPNEFAFDAAYSRLLSDKFSGSVAFRYIRSDLTNGYSGDGSSLQAGNSFAADIAFFYYNKTKINRKKTDISAGINISNIGSKISYDGGNTKEFIPTNLRLGAGIKTEIDRYNEIAFSLDFNKLLVPTPDYNIESQQQYAEEYDKTSVTSAMFQSFNDAPGGFKEELQEIRISAGAEYWYSKQFALRAGYHHEHENKGNRKYMTAGAGLKFNMFTIDASYIIPLVQNNPLANTIRFSLSFDLTEVSGGKRR
ncbi:hypothetical protein DMA11_13945 [Marinilabiliaceae bacterium JC017]|nr:hypothetical protein DMA11_13945 [Marinilabiliaceae bacterium JC017]